MRGFGNVSNDDQITVLNGMLRALGALREQIATTQVALSNTGWILNEVSEAASVTVNIPATADLVTLTLFDIRPATDGAELWMRGVQGGVPLSGASDYAWSNLRAASATSSAGASAIQVLENCDSATRSQATIQLFRPRAGTRFRAAWSGFVMDSTAAQITTASGAGQIAVNTLAVEGVQFLMSTGNISLLNYAVEFRSFGG